MSHRSDREEFIAQLATEGVPVDVARLILRDANTLQRLAAEACNRELSKREERADTAAGLRLTKRATAYKIQVRFDGDPRGACVKLRLPSGRSNDFGGEGFYCVPTRRY